MSSSVVYQVLPRFLRLKNVAINIDRINMIQCYPRYYTIKCASEKNDEHYDNTIVIDKEIDPESYHTIDKFLLYSQQKVN